MLIAIGAPILIAFSIGILFSIWVVFQPDETIPEYPDACSVYESCQYEGGLL